MISQINQILQPEQLLEVLETLFSNCPVKIIRTMARTGKYRQSVPWVYYECEITKTRRATFISIQDLLEGFWAWLECTNLMLMAQYSALAVTKAIWAILPIGVWVWDEELGRAQVVAKDVSASGKRCIWLRSNGCCQERIDVALTSIKLL